MQGGLFRRERAGVILSFSGTEDGIQSEPQERNFKRIVSRIEPVEFHHGCCIGWDEEAHNIIVEMYGDKVLIVGHPPLNTIKMAKKLTAPRMIMRKPKEYLVRDKQMAIEGDILVACPKQLEEVIRSGTWATVRYAKALKKIVYVIFPTGLTVRYLPNGDEQIVFPQKLVAVK